MKNRFFLSLALLGMCTMNAMAGTGDLNDDGQLNVGDVATLYGAILVGDNNSKYDLNLDNQVNVGDVATLYQYIINGVPDDPAPEYLVGGDISMLNKYLDAGAHYNDADSNYIKDPLPWFGQAAGWNAMRVRLFVNPANATDAQKKEGVVQDLDYVVKLGKQIKDAGYQFALDLHYSDTWADPGKQNIPAEWKSIATVNGLADKVYSYTTEVLQTLKAAGATPDLVQTGNEITYGMLWPTGHVYADGGAQAGGSWDYFMLYLNAAAKAVREQCPKAKLILHVEMARNTNPAAFFKTADGRNADYDVIGLSYYPSYHGAPGVLDNVLTTLETEHAGKEIMIMETGYGAQWELPDAKYWYTTANKQPYWPLEGDKTWNASGAGQLQFTKDLIALCKKHESVKGIFWWWPEANEYWVNWQTPVTGSWYNATMFNNYTGKPFPALFELQTFLER